MSVILVHPIRNISFVYFVTIIWWCSCRHILKMGDLVDNGWQHNEVAPSVGFSFPKLSPDLFRISATVPEFISSWSHQILSSSVPEFISSWVHQFLISSVPDFISSWSHQFLISTVPDLCHGTWFLWMFLATSSCSWLLRAGLQPYLTTSLPSSLAAWV